ncbi:GntR family transcriptional regulator, partial [Enterococcus hirae]|uniref:GntR family transcriptional regulator n=1 Tax=Enterococcus hirae TaxID=1354 RepID=UPI0025544664
MKKNAKYMEVYSDVKKKIENGTYAIGEKLPTGSELAKQYHTSKLTVKKGLDMLVSEGVLHSRSGFGTEVLRKPIHNSKVFGPSEGFFYPFFPKTLFFPFNIFSLTPPRKEYKQWGAAVLQ